MTLRLPLVAAAFLSLLLHSAASAQSTLVTFEQQFNAQFLPSGTPIRADAYPVVAHYLVDDYGHPGEPLATVLNHSDGQGNVLRLEGGARFSFNRPIGISGVSFDAWTFVNSGWLELDGGLFSLDTFATTTSGTLNAPNGPWTYTVSQLPSGYFHFEGRGFAFIR